MLILPIILIIFKNFDPNLIDTIIKKAKITQIKINRIILLIWSKDTILLVISVPGFKIDVKFILL